jgi:hypothetical protein
MAWATLFARGFAAERKATGNGVPLPMPSGILIEN